MVCVWLERCRVQVVQGSVNNLTAKFVSFTVWYSKSKSLLLQQKRVEADELQVSTRYSSGQTLKLSTICSLVNSFYNQGKI